jgi:BirA family transcriptional regulator, biotin operon repressor / biotin---[acetyl-CoA-carboxylase] ligase
MPISDLRSFVFPVLQIEETDSTNDLAKRLLDRGTVEPPLLIWADRQTRGRGQGSNAWWSDAGSLTATIVLDPSAMGLTIARESRVALAVAVAVIESIRSLYPGCRPGIRWPNDIEVGGRKLGGILPERVESPSGPRLLIGIGLNVRTRLEGAPIEVRRMAATLGDWAEVTPSADPRAELLGVICDRSGHQLRALVDARPELIESWGRFDALAGSTVRIEIGDEVIEAVAAGIDDSGGLRLIHDGRPRVIHAGRVLRE